MASRATRPNRRGAASPAAIERAARERDAIELRRAGHSFESIAAELGFANRGAAYKAVQRGLSRWMREADEDLRTMELARTDLMISRLQPLVDRDPPDLAAVQTLLRVMDYRARICGLYAPAKYQVGVAVAVKAASDTSMLDAFDAWQGVIARAAGLEATAADAQDAQLALPSGLATGSSTHDRDAGATS